MFRKKNHKPEYSKYIGTLEMDSAANYKRCKHCIYYDCKTCPACYVNVSEEDFLAGNHCTGCCMCNMCNTGRFNGYAAFEPHEEYKHLYVKREDGTYYERRKEDQDAK